MEVSGQEGQRHCQGNHLYQQQDQQGGCHDAPASCFDGLAGPALPAAALAAAAAAAAAGSCTTGYCSGSAVWTATRTWKCATGQRTLGQRLGVNYVIHNICCCCQAKLGGQEGNGAIEGPAAARKDRRDIGQLPAIRAAEIRNRTIPVCTVRLQPDH
eukprot:1160164-Pelagomonas_calceolata.AAC.5